MGSSYLPIGGNVYVGALIGFVVTLAAAVLLNEFGDATFRKGVAKPFFLGRRRVHHRHVLFFVLPLIYSALVAMYLAGYVTIVWSLFWPGIAASAVIAAACLALDLGFDYVRGGGRWGFLHHELIYLTVPAFAFTNFIRLVV